MSTSLGLLTLLVGGLAVSATPKGPTDDELAVLRRCYPIILRAQRSDHFFFDRAAPASDEPARPPLEILSLEPSLPTADFEKLGFEVLATVRRGCQRSYVRGRNAAVRTHSRVRVFASYTY